MYALLVLRYWKISDIFRWRNRMKTTKCPRTGSFTLESVLGGFCWHIFDDCLGPMIDKNKIPKDLDYVSHLLHHGGKIIDYLIILFLFLESLPVGWFDDIKIPRLINTFVNVTPIKECIDRGTAVPVSPMVGMSSWEWRCICAK